MDARDMNRYICIKRFIADLTKKTRAERIGSSNSRLRNAKLGSIHLFFVRSKLNYSSEAAMTAFLIQTQPPCLFFLRLYIKSFFIANFMRRI